MESDPRREKTHMCMKQCRLSHGAENRAQVANGQCAEEAGAAHRSKGACQGQELGSLLQAGGRS